MIIQNTTPFRKLIWFKRLFGENTPSVEKTVSGSVIHVTDALAKPVKKLTVSIVTGQQGSGWTGCNVYHSGEDTTNPTTYPFNFNLLPPTIYNLAQGRDKIQTGENYRGMYCRIPSAGKYTVSRDVVSGNRFRLFATVDEPANNVATYSLINSTATDAELSLTVDFPSGYNYLFIYLANDGSTITSNVKVEAGETASAFVPYVYNGTLDVTTGVLTVDETTYQLTPTQVNLLAGENYVWADTGDSELTYLAEA